jgi:hypothetical protein
MRALRGIVLTGASILALTACQTIKSATDPTAGTFERAADLGLGMDPTAALLPAERRAFAEAWMTRSDLLCRKYKDNIIAASIENRLGADLTATLLGALATIFTPVNTVRGLSGAAAIATGFGAVVQADAFQSQTGQIIASAIQTARQNQANQIEINLKKPEQEYDIYRAQRDVIEYHNMCSLETALVQVQASLRNTAPDAGLTPPANQGNQTSNGLPPAAKQSIDRPVTTNPPGIPSSEKPSGQTANEELERLRIKNVMTAQQALGVTADGRLGRGTRDVIKEFQLGMIARNQTGWSTDGELRGKTADLLTSMTSMPSTGIFLSPFERAYLGNLTEDGRPTLTQLDPNQVDDILFLLLSQAEVAALPKGGSPEAVAARVKTMRDKIETVREDKKRTLDDQLYEELKNKNRLPKGV